MTTPPFTCYGVRMSLALLDRTNVRQDSRPGHSNARRGDVLGRLGQLQELKPEWAIDYTAEGGRRLLKVFVYSRPVHLARGALDLVEIRRIYFPTVAHATPISWLDEQIRRLTDV